MSKNKINLILYGFIGCLFITMVVLAIKIAARPEQAIKDINNNNQVVADNKKDESTTTPDNEKDDSTGEEDSADPGTTDTTGEEDKKDEKDEKDETDKPSGNVKKMVTVKEADTNVNVRSEPDTSSTKLGRIGAGDSYEYLGEQDGEWTKIMFGDQEAYVYTTYIKIIEVTE